VLGTATLDEIIVGGSYRFEVLQAARWPSKRLGVDGRRFLHHRPEKATNRNVGPPLMPGCKFLVEGTLASRWMVEDHPRFLPAEPTFDVGHDRMTVGRDRTEFRVVDHDVFMGDTTFDLRRTSRKYCGCGARIDR